MLQAKFNEITFTDKDIVNADDYIPQGQGNPHKVRPFLLHEHGIVLAVVFADCLQDAIDEAVDAGKLDKFKVAQEDFKDYPKEEGLSFLGNHCEPYDIESLEAIELPNPPFSFVALFNARKENT